MVVLGLSRLYKTSHLNLLMIDLRGLFGHSDKMLYVVGMSPLTLL